MLHFLRRRKLGRTSCREIAAKMQQEALVSRDVLEHPFHPHDFIVRWGTTANIPANANVINSAEAIHRVNDKAGFRRVLNEHQLCPMTWFDYNDDIADGVAMDTIVRPAYHAQGRNLYLCHTFAEIVAACDRCGPGYYISKYVPKVAEYRVFVAQGRAVWVAKKTPGNPEDIAWNVARGGRFDNVRWDDWPLRVVKTAIEAFNLSGLDFGGVDVMVGPDGRPYVLEINSAPSQTSPYRQECVAKVFDFIVTHDKNTIPLVDRLGGWKKFIHPALSQEAVIG